jgi:hypothetical protein
MAALVELLSRNNPVYTAFVFYAAILILKMLLMSALTARQRMRKKVRGVGCLKFPSFYSVGTVCCFHGHKLI